MVEQDDPASFLGSPPLFSYRRAVSFRGQVFFFDILPFRLVEHWNNDHLGGGFKHLFSTLSGEGRFPI